MLDGIEGDFSPQVGTLKGRRKYVRFIVDSGIFGVSLAETFAYKPLLA
ncbi:hypothetical protein [Ensifer aridi]|nr:hypothetical protein [Ensifer aridi]